VPPSRAITFGPGDLAGQGFSTVAHHLTGTATQQNGTPCAGLQVDLTGPAGARAAAVTNDLGHFDLEVPNRSQSRPVTVAHADVGQLDFQKVN
jgi:hypothetical protein